MDFGLPQGSTQGTYPFNCYASTFSKIVPDPLTLNGFADDHSIRRTFTSEKTHSNRDNTSPSEDNTIAILERSMQDIKAWMEAVKPKLNEVKTEFIYFGRRQHLNKMTYTTINAIGESIKRSTKVRYLGGHLDSNLTLKEHILMKCKALTLNIIMICNIGKNLTKEMCHKLILQLVISHLDYTKSILAGLQSSSIKIMPKIQNTATRLILRKIAKEVPKNLTLVTNTVKDRLQICTLIHKCCNQKTPVYLQNLIQEKKINQPSLRMENKKALLAVPHIRKHTFASRSFSIHGPNLWNSLPDRIRREIIFEIFKEKLISSQLHTCKALSIKPGIP